MVRRYAYVCAQIFYFLYLSGAAFAQNVNPVLPTGDAAVAGFSGTIVVGSQPPPEARRLDKTFINLDGPALRVIDLTRMGGPPQGQLVNAAKLFTATAGQIGQVFALALDDANPPNIYAAASSAYGLPIVVPDADGDGFPDRSHRGAPNAAFMPGLFGPVQLNGGPGSIWKINGQTGAVTLFANVVLAGVPNSGPALGGMAFDRGSRQLFVADRDTGMIHRFTLDGVERGRFDHGVQGLAATGLPAIAFDPRKRLNVESPNFDSGNPVTWAYAPPARRVFGMAVSGGRLYYAVAAGLRIWSVSILPDGSFGPDARVEVTVPPGALPGSEVSEILFDDNGDMLVAERGAPTGAYDYKALAAAGENRVLRFRPKTPDDPPSRDLWFPIPREYAIGFPPTFRNDNGGIAIGYGYDQAGNINRGVCGGTLWGTGEQLRNARDPEIIRRLQAGGPLLVDGLQGNSTRLLRPLNEPPFEAWYIDYDDRFDDPQTRGHLGDVVIWRTCGQAILLPVVPIICPLGFFDIEGVCRVGLLCPQGTEFSNGCCVHRGCPASYVRINGRCLPPPRTCGEGETYSEGGCQAPRCPAGLVPVKRSASRNGLPTATNAQLPRPPDAPQQSTDCGPGEIFTNDHCQPGPPDGGRPKMCVGGTYCACPDGSKPNAEGKCPTPNGCGPHEVFGDGQCLCQDGYQSFTGSNGQRTCIPTPQCDAGTAQCCPASWHWNRTTHSCDPDNQNQPPNLKINKQIGACQAAPNSQGGNLRQCIYDVVIYMDGPGTYTGPISFTDQSTGNPISAQASDIPPGWTCTTGTTVTCQSPPGATVGPNRTISMFVTVIYQANTRGENCVALGNAAPVNSSTPSNNVSCAPFCVGGTEYCSGTQSPPVQPRLPPPPTITGTCPEGTRMGFNGQCFFVDPGCRGPNCGTGCAGGAARNSDGNCPTPPTSGCTGGKVMDDNACRCEYPKVEDSKGDCKAPKTESRRPRKKPRRTVPNSDNPPAQSGPQFNIQIGPGFPGGGRPGGGNKGGGNKGGCGARCG